MALRGKRGGLHRWGPVRRAADDFENVVTFLSAECGPTGLGGEWKIGRIHLPDARPVTLPLLSALRPNFNA